MATPSHQHGTLVDGADTATLLVAAGVNLREAELTGRWGRHGAAFPAFLGYLCVAFTKASAFSLTEAMPLGVRVRTLMLIGSIASFLTVGLVAVRAVNILNT